jgi:hypothetical protein
VNLPLDQSADPQPRMAVFVERKTKGKKKKKKKKKQKTGLLVRVIGKLFLGSAAAFEQVGDAVSGAADKYSRKHEKSRLKRRNGWRKDFARNFAAATSTLMARSAKAPGKFAKTLWKKTKKQDRKAEKAKREERARRLGPDVASGRPTPGA